MLNTFYADFDLLKEDSAVKSTPPPEDWALSVTSVYEKNPAVREYK